MSIVNLDEIVTQERFGSIIGISQQAVCELINKQVLQKKMPVGIWIKAYCANLREVAAGRAGDGELDLVTERAGLAREQRIRIELQNAVTRKEYGPIYELETGLADCMAQVAAQLDTIPGKLKRRSDKLTISDINLVREIIAEARNTIAALKIDWFSDTNAKDLSDVETAGE
jgi:phage terminase Nu1 subunit (DNA packaging protein)